MENLPESQKRQPIMEEILSKHNPRAVFQRASPYSFSSFSLCPSPSQKWRRMMGNSKWLNGVQTLGEPQSQQNKLIIIAIYKVPWDKNEFSHLWTLKVNIQHVTLIKYLASRRNPHLLEGQPLEKMQNGLNQTFRFIQYLNLIPSFAFSLDKSKQETF